MSLMEMLNVVQADLNEKLQMWTEYWKWLKGYSGMKDQWWKRRRHIKKMHKNLLNLQFYPSLASLIWYNACFIVCRALDTPVSKELHLCSNSVITVWSLFSSLLLQIFIPIGKAYPWAPMTKRGTTAIISTLNFF